MSLSSFIYYGGFQFGIERITRWEQRAVYSDDGADYLYTAHDIEVLALFNPGGIASHTMQGQLAAESIRDLRTQVLRPRQELRVEIGNVEVLRSPRQRDDVTRTFLMDAKNGPQPLSFDVVQIYGFRTALVRFRVMTWVNDCADGDRPAILSHRWEQTIEIDDRFYSTRITRGTATFRTDYLYDDPVKARRTPDNYRAWLVGGHPIPDGFKRETIRVNVSSDGTQLHYEVRDVEQSLNLGLNNPVARIRGHWTCGYSGEGFFSYMPQGVRHVGVVIECWGRKTSRKTDLMRACLRVASTFGLAPGGLFGGAGLTQPPPSYTKGEFFVSLDEKYVRLSLGCILSGTFQIASTSLLPGFTAGGAVDQAFKVANLQEVFPEDLADVAVAAETPNPRPTEGCRGSYLGTMVIAALNEPCQVQLKARDMEGATLRTDVTYAPLS